MNQRIRWKTGNAEIEVEGEESFVERQLERFLKTVGPGRTIQPAREERDVPEINVGDNPDLAPGEFLRQTRPKGGTKTLVALAKYLLDYRKKAEFSKEDIRNLTLEARTKDIHNQYYIRAIEQGLIRSAGQNQFAITLTGEDELKGMVGGTNGNAN